MASIPEPEEEHEEVAEWLTTFADLSMLLLTFFVLLFSMSTLDKQKFSESFSSVLETFGGSQLKHIAPPEAQKETPPSQMLEQLKQMLEEQRQVFNETRSFISRSALENDVSAQFDDGVITLRVPSEVLFEKGSVELRPEAIPFLLKLKDFFLRVRDQNISIRGYTDDSPIPQNARFKDNWELSALRAVNVLRFMLAEGIELVRLTATGLGDLDPLLPNTSEENRQKNRRVEFVLERKVGRESL